MGDDDTREDRHASNHEGSTEAAGVLRALARSTATVYRTITFGQLPRRIPVKSVSVASDWISTAIEYYSHLEHHHKEVKKHGHKEPEQQPRVEPRVSLRERGVFVAKVVRSALPALAQSAILGTAVFSLYDAVKDYTDKAAGVLLGKTDRGQRECGLLPVLASSSVAGGVAGCAHGVMSTAWEHVGGWVRHQRVSMKLVGTMTAHTVSHAVLFGGYETCKQALMRSGGLEYSDPLGVAAVAVAGGVAGACEQTVSYYTVRWEEQGVCSLTTLWRTHGRPPLRMVASAVLPSCFGFVAYEYARDLVLQQDEYVETDQQPPHDKHPSAPLTDR